jgi:hypothetical protein
MEEEVAVTMTSAEKPMLLSVKNNILMLCNPLDRFVEFEVELRDCVFEYRP